MEISSLLIDFIDGMAKMSIADLNREFPFVKQSVMTLMHRAHRHGFCVDNALHDDWGPFSGRFGE